MKNAYLIILLLFLNIYLHGQEPVHTDLPLADEFIKVDTKPISTNLYFIRDKIGYPAKALKKKIEGKVFTRVLVNPQGAVEKYILTRVDHPYLAEAVKEEIEYLKFIPALRNDSAINYWVNIPFLFYTNHTYRPRGQKHNYRTLVQKVFKSNFQKSQDFLTEGIDLFNKRSYKEAGLKFKDCFQHTPKQKSFRSQVTLIQANYYLANCYLQLQNVDRAIPYYTEAIGMSRTLSKESDEVSAILPSIYLARGYALLKSNEPARALQDYNYASKNFASHMSFPKTGTASIPHPWRTDLDWVSYQKGLVYLQLEKNQESIEHFSIVCDLNPTSPLKQVALSHRGLAKSKLGNFEGAFNDIQAAIEIDEEDPQAFYLKAMVLMEVESQEMAQELLEQAKKLFAKLENKYSIPSIYPANE